MHVLFFQPGKPSFKKEILFFVDSGSAYIVLENPRDVDLASLSISIYLRWRPGWRPIISEKLCDMEKCLKPVFCLKLFALQCWDLNAGTHLETDYKM